MSYKKIQLLLGFVPVKKIAIVLIILFVYAHINLFVLLLSSSSSLFWLNEH